jgi:hypothetical protein
MDLVQNRQCAFKDVLGLETCFGLYSTIQNRSCRRPDFTDIKSLVGLAYLGLKVYCRSG